MRDHQFRSGFTLVELLLAMFILSIGMAAIASVFPMAGYLQKQTVDEVLTLQVKRNAEAVLLARGISEATVAGIKDNDGKVYALPLAPSPSTEIAGIPLADRCYPSISAKPVAERSMYWVPLIQDANTQTNQRDWRIYVFILSRRADATYGSSGANPNDGTTIPKVRASKTVSGIDRTDEPYSASFTATLYSGTASDHLQGGDQVLFSTGQIATVIESNDDSVKVSGSITGTPDRIWYGESHAAGKQGPTRRIVLIGGEVVR